ncbi:MAG: outer membrane beta-barrel protein [Bdellovibrionota bacterium]
MRSLFITFFLLLPVLAHAENQFGAIAGLNIPHVEEPLLNIMVGAYADFSLTETQYLTAQLRYGEKGAKGQAVIDGREFDITCSFNYLQLPLYFKYKFSSNSKLRPNIFAGPSLGWRLGDSYMMVFRGTKNQIGGDSIFERNLKRFDLAAEAGAGMEWAYSKSTVGSFALTYSRGLLNISRNARSVKTEGFIVYAGVGW